MAQVEHVAPLTMTWCVDCHRDPAPHLRSVAAVMPRDDAFSGAT
jgi:hypothetical protein